MSASTALGEVAIMPRPAARLHSTTAAVIAALLFVATALFWVRERWILTLLQAGACGLAIAWCLFLLRQPLAGRPLIFLAPAALACWGWLQLAARATEYPQATLEAALAWTSWLALFFAARQGLAAREARDAFLRASIWFAGGLSLLAVVQFFTSDGRIYWLWETDLERVLGPFRNRNHYAAFAVLLLPVALWDALTRRGRRLRALCAAGTLVFAVLAGASRAGIILVLAEIALLAALARSRGLLAPSAGRRALVAIVLLVCGLGGVLGSVRRFAEPDPLALRREIWGASLAMIRERPWTGFGLGTFETVYPAYARFDNGQIVDHAHNDWLEWAAEGGIPFALLLAGVALWSARRAMRQPWLLGVPVICAHSLLDYPLQKPALAAWAVTLLAAAASDSGRSTTRRAWR